MISFLNKLFGKSSIDYKELMEKGAVIIDVRSVAEFKSGHMAGSKNMPLDNIRSKVKELKNLNKPVITVCRSGARSNMAKGILKSAGLEVYNGGSWTSLKNRIV